MTIIKCRDCRWYDVGGYTGAIICRHPDLIPYDACGEPTVLYADTARKGKCGANATRFEQRKPSRLRTFMDGLFG